MVTAMVMVTVMDMVTMAMVMVIVTRNPGGERYLGDEKMLFDVIRASFNERRKTLQNGIANYAGFSFSKAEALQAIEACGFKPAVRGEALALSEFGKLADELCLIRESRKRVNEGL